ncbi:MAG TPA: hypothetical protein VM142_05685 [Acidimicrobiales bacterium]|nr:hypothetical protein [Acidimicrobiales bacterium]
MKKGRHRRFEEARAFKLRPTELPPEPCAECGADPEDDHASWCLATEDLATDEPGADELITGVDPRDTGGHGHGQAMGSS